MYQTSRVVGSVTGQEGCSPSVACTVQKCTYLVGAWSKYLSFRAADWREEGLAGDSVSMPGADKRSEARRKETLLVRWSGDKVRGGARAIHARSQGPRLRRRQEPPETPPQCRLSEARYGLNLATMAAP